MIGVAGQGMAPLARLLTEAGFTVSGCDRLQLNPSIPQHFELLSLGIAIAADHSPHHLQGVDAVVVSNAIPDDEVEVVTARSKPLSVSTRAEALGRLLHNRSSNRVGIAGVYGKSTTTALAVHMLKQLGRSPTYYIGASNTSPTVPAAALGTGTIAVYEACEYRNDFLHAPRETALILNAVMGEHPETHPTVNAMLAAFDAFLTDAQTVVLCSDDARLMSHFGRRAHLTFGFRHDATVRVTEVGEWSTTQHMRRTAFNIDTFPLEVTFRLPGRHNVVNAAAALAALISVGVDPRGLASDFLANFGQLSRRLQPAGLIGTTAIIDDYAHSPTQIRAARRYLQSDMRAARIGCIFQPSCFRRLVAQLTDLTAELALWDAVWLLHPIQPCTGDDPSFLRGITIDSIASAVSSRLVSQLQSLDDLTLRDVTGLDGLCCFGGPRMNGAAAQLLTHLRTEH